MRDLAAFHPVDGTDIGLDVEDVDAGRVRAGSPRIGTAVLHASPHAEVGVWEMTAGAMVDIEIDEVFVVVAGEASVTLLDDGRPIRVIQLRPGVVCRLEAGMATLWNVPRVLRKVYFLSASAGSI